LYDEQNPAYYSRVSPEIPAKPGHSILVERPVRSIVIPAFNEAARIRTALDRVLHCVHSRGWNAEILVVDDGSTDETAAIVKDLGKSHPEVRLLEHGGNRGKGFSVRHGVLSAAGDVILFTDADLSAPIEEAEFLFTAIDDGADIAIGSRWLDRERQTVRQPLFRRFFGRCFNQVTRRIMGLPFADTQCGFKAFRRSAARTIFQLQRIERWGFDPELLYIGSKRGFSIREVAISWAHDDRSRLSYFKDGLRMLEEIVRIRWNALVGVYNRKVIAEARSARPA
jgi:glycosyltransferase involved in cell wall biosynthesis